MKYQTKWKMQEQHDIEIISPYQLIHKHVYRGNFEYYRKQIKK